MAGVKSRLMYEPNETLVTVFHLHLRGSVSVCVPTRAARCLFPLFGHKLTECLSLRLSSSSPAVWILFSDIFLVPCSYQL